MRFPERKDAIMHCEKLGGDLCKTDDRGFELVIMVPNKESAYAYARGDEGAELKYEEGFKIVPEGIHYETYCKDRAGKWVKAIM